MSDYRKRTIRIMGGMILIYFILIFGYLKLNIPNLVFEFVGTLIYLGTGQFELIPDSIKSIVLDVILLGGGMWFFTYFFSQFALPAFTIKERQQVSSRIFNSIGENIGPAIFIQNGQVIERRFEQKRRGPGVILLDSASAALLHNKATHTRAVGPGLTFTNSSERIYNTIDLRTQVRKLGPKDDDWLFSETEPEDETPEEAAARKERRLQTSGLTRDGIEIVPNITVVFRLDADPGEGNSAFGYRPESVVKALRHEAIAAGSSGKENPNLVTWDWLPAHLAANLWREYLRKYTINELFDITKHEVNYPGGDQTNVSATVYDHIISMINARLKNEEVVSLNDVGETVPNLFSASREYALLQEHGLRVIAARVENLRLQDEDRLIDRWKATWLSRANKEKSNIKKYLDILTQKAAEDAQMEFAETLVTILYQDIASAEQEGRKPPDLPKSLYALMRGTRTAIIRDPNYNRELADERGGLDALIEWLQDYQNGSR